jgi:hypothetical protein
MELFGIVAIAVPVVGAAIGFYAARQPAPWDEIGGESPVDVTDAAPPSTLDDEADLRALVAAKRARRQAGDGPAVASDRLRVPGAVPAAGPPWAHLEAEVVTEARELLARRRTRLERQGKPIPDEQAELERLLGPPHP